MSLVSLEEAVELLKQNKVVAVPTETVYGLAGRIYSEEALKLIFSTKRRPFFDPLIVHVRDIIQARSLVQTWPRIAEVLAENFWPGPLTLVLPKSDLVSNLISSGLTTVGIRCPDHPVALKILDNLGEPFAAPSANLFGKTSPTMAQHVLDELNGVSVVEGGPCQIGIESTVVAINSDSLSLLRPGKVSKDQIDKILNENGLITKWIEQKRSDSPGQMKHHYMPSKPLFTVEESFKGNLLEKLNHTLAKLPYEVEGVKLVKPKSIQSIIEIKLNKDPSTAARELYAQLRQYSSSSEDALVFYFKNEHRDSSWSAIIERISKASSAWIT
ncbi:MAG: L-threonylcarbamoyladenylate synthase [Bdellovibrionales bacterium]